MPVIPGIWVQGWLQTKGKSDLQNKPMQKSDGCRKLLPGNQKVLISKPSITKINK